MDIPPDVAIRASIRPGSVYYFRHEELTSPKPHYFVVINIDPTSEEVILLVCASSKIGDVRLRNRNNPQATLVEIGPAQYPGFSSESIFDCNNSVFPQSIQVLVQRLANKRLVMKSEMGTELVSN